MREEFIKSLKAGNGNTEELADLYIYRPLGFLLAKLLDKTGITPNSVTIIGLLWGIIAGILLSFGTPLFFLYGAIAFQIANIFDCADGQLARMKSMYSLFGRILDGFVDYVSSIAVFLGAYVGLLRYSYLYRENYHLVFFVILIAAIGRILSAVTYDKLKSKYINMLEGKEEIKDTVPSVLEKIRGEKKGLKRVFFYFYLYYVKVQLFFTNNFSFKKKWEDSLTDEELMHYRKLYVKKNTNLLKVWSFVGPSANVFYFLIFALQNRVFEYFVFAATVLNILFVILVFIQGLKNRNLNLEMKTVIERTAV